MQKQAFLLSLTLHACILGLMMINFSLPAEKEKTPQAVMMIDLTKVKIAEKTNLPQKSIKKKKQQTKQPVQPKQEKQKTTQITPKKEIKTPAPKPKPQETPPPKQAVAVQPPKQDKKQEKAQPKPQPKQPETKTNYNLKTLLASVEKVRQAIPTPEPQEQPTQQETISNSLEGRIDKVLTISEKDFIASKLRECWNIDGGAQNIEEIIIEIKVLLNKDGSVREATISNNMNLPAFKSLAESARRAVHICAQKGEESPFKILANTYAEHYNDWKELHLHFNPMDANVF